MDTPDGLQPLSSETRLVIICDKITRPRVLRSLDSLAGYDWKLDERIGIIELPYTSRRAKGVWQKITDQELLACKNLDTVFVCVELHQNAPRAFRSEIQYFPCDRERFHKLLERRAILLNLDWKSRAVNKLRIFSREITKDDVTSWAHQFRKLGNKEWIAEVLIKLIEVWPQARLTAELRLAEDTSKNFTKICVTELGGGKSSAVMMNLIKHELERLDPFRQIQVKQFKSEFELTPYTKDSMSFLVVEDCIMSGREMIKFFNSISPLFESPFDHLTKHQIEVRCSFITRLGYQRVIEFFSRRNINNVKVIEPQNGLFENLTAEGLSAYADGRLFDENLQINHPEKHLSTGLEMQFNKMSFESYVKDKIISFCEEVGFQLLRHNLTEIKQIPRENVDQYPKSWGLGNEGLGILVIFPHSVPSSCPCLLTIPGTINFDGKIVKWKALFP